MSKIDYQNINYQNTKLLDSYNDIRNQITMNEKNTLKPSKLKIYYDNVNYYLLIIYYCLFIVFLYFLYFIKINNYLKIGIILLILVYPFLVNEIKDALYPYSVYYFCLVLGIPYNPSKSTINKKVIINYYNEES